MSEDSSNTLILGGKLFRTDPYLQDAQGVVTGHTAEGGLILEASLFFPTGGGQPGDSGRIEWSAFGQSHSLPIATTIISLEGAIVLVPAEPSPLPAIGTRITQRLDWARRHRHMRIHTALHLLSALVTWPVIGSSIGAERGRLDVAMSETLLKDAVAAEPLMDEDALEVSLNALIEKDLPVSEKWLRPGQLEAGLLKTIHIHNRSEHPEKRVRLIAIGDEKACVDLQPCGGTHVARTSEIGRIRIGRIAQKGPLHHRITLQLD